MKNSDIILENIYNRKSVRRFTNDKIEKEDLMSIVKAGISAPSTCNLQPWHFIVIDDKKTLEDMASIHEYARMFNTATGGIIVLGDSSKVFEGGELFWSEDCAAATENILLAVEALGLGAVWTGIFPIEDRVNKLKDYFNLPSEIIPFSLIAIGHPSGKWEAMDKWDESKIHLNKW